MVSRVFQKIGSRDVIVERKKVLTWRRGVPTQWKFDNFIFKMGQSGAFWRSYLC